MFTGIVEEMGKILRIEPQGSNKSFWVESTLSQQFKIDQSVSHSGVCLTVDALAEGCHRVTAIAETLQKTILNTWETGSLINLERCLPVNGRLDGHLVQGHVDSVAECLSVEDQGGSWLYTFSFPGHFAHLVIEKGSVCLNGISLTAFNVTRNTLQVAIIPYTYEHTNIGTVTPGIIVNVEFDILGKYMSRWRELEAG
jgi:riboflavin synthase